MKPPKTYMSRVHKPLCSIWAQCFVSTTYAARKRTRHPEKHELPPSRKRILEEQTFQKAPETLEKLGELFCASKFADANHRRTHGLRIFKDKEKEAMNWNQGTSRMQFTQLSQLKVLVSLIYVQPTLYVNNQLRFRTLLCWTPQHPQNHQTWIFCCIYIYSIS